MGETRLDMRSQMNYALVLFATGKILEKLQMKEAYLNIVESLFSEKVVPRHIQLLDQDEGRADSAVDYNEEEVAEMMAVVNRIVQSCFVDPEKTKHFFIPKTSLTKYDKALRKHFFVLRFSLARQLLVLFVILC